MDTTSTTNLGDFLLYGLGIPVTRDTLMDCDEALGLGYGICRPSMQIPAHMVDRLREYAPTMTARHRHSRMTVRDVADRVWRGGEMPSNALGRLRDLLKSPALAPGDSLGDAEIAFVSHAMATGRL